MSKKLTTEEFIERAKEVHGDKYDYSKVEYVNNRTKVCIICPKHGEFWQIANHHICAKQGCARCARKEIATSEEFIEKAIKKYGDKYDYSEVNYISPQIPIIIKCNKCGNKFEEIALGHLSGSGCSCYNNKGKKRQTLEEFLSKANEVHQNKYDYRNVTFYPRGKFYITPICHNKDRDGVEHGTFTVRAESHLYGKIGCPKCASESRPNSQRVSLEEFKKRAKETHGDEYDYSLITNEIYRGYRELVPIICSKHGVFYQIAKKHVEGQGCKHCKKSNLEREVEKLLIENGIEFVYFKNDFEWLKSLNNRPQSLDFYLPKHNIGIECQGEQHFFLVDFANRGKKWAEEQLKIVQSLDERKKKLCEENGVKLLYYSHIKADNNINELNKLLETIENI